MATINVLISTFTGLDLPPTLCLSVPGDLTFQKLQHLVAALIPSSAARNVFLTTNQGRTPNSAEETIRSIAQRTSDESSTQALLPLRLNVPLRGGKGGFGSQLRAAGGRMSTKRRKQLTELASGSARNLDGRRLRTITEAKNLATYLATKPDMDRKEKEERRKRWEAVIELAEQREADMRAGKAVDGRRKGLSSGWIEEKEEVGENVKNAVNAAMAAADRESDQAGSGGSPGSAHNSADEDSDIDEPMELSENDMKRLRVEAEAGDSDALWVLQNKLKIPKDLLPKAKPKTPRFVGFDDDDDYSESGSDEETQDGLGESHKVKSNE